VRCRDGGQVAIVGGGELDGFDRDINDGGLILVAGFFVLGVLSVNEQKM
jgi:hypothetical protein